MKTDEITRSAEEPSDPKLDTRLGLAASSIGLLVAGFASAYGVVNTEKGQQVATSFDDAGMPTAFGSRLEAFGLLPAVLAGLALTFWILPRVDPLRTGIRRAMKGYNAAWAIAVGIIVIAHVALTRAAVHGDIGDVSVANRVVLACLGVLYLAMGNYFPKTGRNWLFGIPTPWTMKNDRVWADTHRVAGPIVMALGVVALVLALAAPAGLAIALVVGGLLAVFVAMNIYSFFIYRTLDTL